jgi:putative phosphoesterase
MLIGLISDTHIAWPRQTLPPQVKQVFQGVDLILHAGDIWISRVLDELEMIAPVLAAQGDDDFEADIGKDKRVAERQTLSYEGLNILVTHVKPRRSLLNPTSEEAYVHASLFSTPATPQDNRPPDIIIFGHNHYPEVENYNGIFLVSPGSATMPMYVPKLGTVGLLTLNKGKAEARIIQLE